MKKVAFNITDPKENSKSKVLKVLNALNCRLSADFKKGVITAECADDTDLDAIIDLVDTNYTVSSISVDNMEQGDVPVNVSEMQNSSENKSLANFPSLPESDNLLLNGRLQNLLTTANYSINKGKLSSTQLNKFITSITTEISSYSKTTPNVQSVSVGDVIACYYGHNLKGEISGAFTQAIVYETCDRKNHIVRLLPIVAKASLYDSNLTLDFSAPEDIAFYSKVANHNSGTVMVDRIDWVSLFRIREVVGKASPDFMKTLRLMLKTSFTSDEDIQPAKEVSDLSVLLPSTEPSPKPQAKTRSGSIEEILYEHLSPIIDEIEPGWDLHEKVRKFMCGIAFPGGLEINVDAFTIAYDLDRITYNNLLAKLQLIHNRYSEEEIKQKLKDVFQIWLKTMPELAEDLPPRVAITDLLKFFVKYVGKPQN